MSRLTTRTAKKGGYHHGDLKNALIEAGADILSKQGVARLSLRKVAQRAGVSHAAPYAHFADKQALIAAISTEGYRRLNDAMSAAAGRHAGDPAKQLVEGAWAYVKFALEDTDHFRVTMSGIVEKEKDYPAFVDMSQRSFELLLAVVAACQSRGVLRSGPTEIVAVSVWSLVHGLVSLLLEKQIPHTVLRPPKNLAAREDFLEGGTECPLAAEGRASDGRLSMRELVVATLNQLTCVELSAG